MNIVATYGRSLYALLVGLFTSRWTLQALGNVDYGLYGVVGGLTAFISFINSIFSVSISRFYAFHIGASKIGNHQDQGVEECCRWFNAAVVIHTVIPISLVLIGYPIGLWAIRNWLTIPDDRIMECIWLFRLACLSCFIGMFNVPFNAMYAAKQYIAELTVYGFMSTTVTFFFLLYMVTHPGMWLVKYGGWMCFVSVIPMMIIIARAMMIFPECRIRLKYMTSLQRIKQLGGFAGWYAFGMFGNLLRYQGLTILVNKQLGPTMNASLAVANNIASHSHNLAGALVGAFSPALTTACGERRMDAVESLMYKICRFGAVLILIFAIPMCLEIHEIMKLWLVSVPSHADDLAVWIMVSMVLESITTGHWIAISANGTIKIYQIFVGICFVLTLPIAYLFMRMGSSVVAVGYSLCATLLGANVIRVVMVWRLLSFRPLVWVKEVLFPVIFVVCFSSFSGFLVLKLFEESLFRVVITTLAVECILLPLTWIYILRDDERVLLVNKLKKSCLSIVARR